MNDRIRQLIDSLKPLWQSLKEQASLAYGRLGPRGTTVLVLGCLFVIVILQNLDSIEIDILFWEIYVPKLVFFIGLTALGFAFGYLAGTSKRQS